MIALIEAYQAGLLKARYWYTNLIAGIIVGIVALPLAMAFAIASGVKPEQGLYTAIIASVVVGLFGGSRVQIAGPTGAFVVILASITAQYGVSGLQVATFLAGLILVFMGMIKLGSVIKFIPDPVITGFTSGIGIIIFVSQLKDFFGLPIALPATTSFYHKMCTILQALPDLNIPTTGLAILSLFLVLITPKISKRIPGPLVAMVVITIVQVIFEFKHVATIGNTFGGIPEHLPMFQVPSFSMNQLVDLIGPAFTIALLAAIESLLSATAADGMAGTRHHSNQELIGQGFANIIAPFWGGFASTGAIARTATSVRNGGNSPIASIVHAMVLLLVILFLAPWASYIPLSALSAILFVVAYNMSDFPYFISTIKRAPWYDVLVLGTAFLLTIFIDLVVAVNVGVILAMLFFVQRMHKTVTVEEQTLEKIQLELPSTDIVTIPQNTIVYAIQGPFFFGVVEKIERTLAKTYTDPRIIIFRLKNVPFIDMTGLKIFYELIQKFHNRGVDVYICEANSRVTHKLETARILSLVQGNQVFLSVLDILNSLKKDL